MEGGTDGAEMTGEAWGRGRGRVCPEILKHQIVKQRHTRKIRNPIRVRESQKLE